jgi:diguanylate cyclase (GGDEF)-like protein
VQQLRRRRTRPPVDRRAQLRAAVVIGTALLFVMGVGYLDYVTGPDIGMSLFYLPPIVAVAWYYGGRASLVVALTAAACWFLADYLIRVSLGVSLWNGLTRLVIYVSQGLLIAALREDRRRQATLARTDPVTGLANSRAFQEMMRRAADESAPLCVASIDLDNFKEVNDRHGHPKGDDVLEQTAAALRSSIRSGDAAARIGGDEFALLLFDVSERDAEVIGARILEKVRSIAADVADCGLGASVGFAISKGGMAPVDLLSAADQAMYESKRAGKGAFTIRVVSL